MNRAELMIESIRKNGFGELYSYDVADELENLLAANRHCVNYFNDLKNDYDKLRKNLVLVLNALNENHKFHQIHDNHHYHDSFLGAINMNTIRDIEKFLGENGVSFEQRE